jgi:hypothetical protein
MTGLKIFFQELCTIWWRSELVCKISDRSLIQFLHKSSFSMCKMTQNEKLGSELHKKKKIFSFILSILFNYLFKTDFSILSASLHFICQNIKFYFYKLFDLNIIFLTLPTNKCWLFVFLSRRILSDWFVRL